MKSKTAQDSELFLTKLHIPQIRAPFVDRPRLTQLLGKGGLSKLTLISAPAGYGKSSLLANWLASTTSRVGWLSLDKDDNDPIRFYRYLLSSLQSSVPEISQSDPLLSHPVQNDEITQMLPGLVNDLLDFPGIVFLVIDNYHVIEEPKIHQALSQILEFQPVNLHIFIATRSDPPLPIARLRARGELVEIRSSDLQFSPAESLTFFNQGMGLQLSRQDVDLLVKRTEGWITGMKLAGLSLRDQQDPALFIRTFSGSNTHIAAFLTEEVIKSQSEEVSFFLQRTSILPYFTADLCQAITGSMNAAEILESIQDLFLIPLDNEGRWFRYHQLFADLLQRQLQAIDPDLEKSLHRTAKEWFLANGFPEQAIEHAFLSGDYQDAAHLLSSRIAEIVWGHGEQYAVQKWLAALPEEWRRSHPLLRVYEAFSLLQIGSPPERIRELLDQSEAEDQDQILLGEIAAIRASVANFEGQLSSSIQNAQYALDHLAEDQLVFRSLATRILGISYRLMGNPALAIEYFSQALAISESTSDLLGAVAALHQIGDMHMLQLKYQEAESQYNRALEKARDRQGKYLPIAIRVLASLAQLQYQRNQLSTAREYVEKSIALATRFSGYPSYSSYQVMAMIRQAADMHEEALHALNTAKAQIEEQRLTTFANLAIQAFQAHLALLRGSIESAAHWAQELQARVDLDQIQPFYLQELVGLNFARIHLALGELDPAEELIEMISSNASSLGRTSSETQAQVLRSLLHWKRGKAEQALESLNSALEAAQPERCIRIFLDEGPSLIPVLQSAASRGSSPSFLADILKAAVVAHQSGTGSPGILADPLTPRELDVLRLLARGLTSGEIAQELVISSSTVRSHLKNIYTKLNVHKRWDAAQRAQDLRLI